MSPKLRAELDKLMNGKENYLAGKSEAEQIAFLQSMSYRDYLLKVVGVSEDCLFFVKGVWALGLDRSEEHTSELQSLMRISYAAFCLQQKKQHDTTRIRPHIEL